MFIPYLCESVRAAWVCKVRWTFSNAPLMYRHTSVVNKKKHNYNCGADWYSAADYDFRDMQFFKNIIFLEFEV